MSRTKEQKFWSSYGKIYPYIERSTPYQKLLRDIGELIAPKEGERWLDVGCGPGTVMQVIMRRSTGLLDKLVGIDFDETMLTHAREKMSKERRVEFLRIDLSGKTPFESETFDGVIANLVLTYIARFENKAGEDSLRGVLGEMHRILKPGGRFVWTTPVKDVRFWKVFVASRKDLLKKDQRENLFYGPAILRYAQMIARKGRRGEYNFLSAHEHEAIMRELGFKDVTVAKSFADQALVIAGRK